VAALGDLRGTVSLRVEVLPQTVESQDALRPHCVRIMFGSIEEARSQLLAYGGSVEVIEPLALQLTLADFAREIAAVYADGPPKHQGEQLG
jgi:hypothetical protein